MKVIEWFKRKIIRTGDLNIKSEEIEEWGDSRAELGAYLDDLKRARYFTKLPLSDEALENYIQDMSPLVVTQGLQMVLFWCLRKLDLPP